ncbi:hypothetical protein ACFLTB_03555 [Chloroflexota bacterium]
MRILVSLLAIAVLIPGIIAGCSLTEATVGGNKVFTKKEIPSIDTSAPVVTETATFALG